MTATVVNREQPVSLLRKFLSVQQERAQLYTGFQGMFKAYLASKDEALFRRGLQQTTAGFSSCSAQVRQIEAKLNEDVGRADLGGLLRCIQEHEREKLRLTLALQSLQQAHAFQVFSWQQEEDVDILEPPRARTCGCGSAFGHSVGAGSSGADVHAEPSESEWTLALREAQLALDGAVRGINEKIEEVREAIAELSEL